MFYVFEFISTYPHVLTLSQYFIYSNSLRNTFLHLFLHSVLKMFLRKKLSLITKNAMKILKSI